MKKLFKIQFYLLLVGVILAWINFAVELGVWLYSQKACTNGCSINAANPFTSPCFFGALIFTAAFIINSEIQRKVKKSGLEN